MEFFKHNDNIFSLFSLVQGNIKIKDDFSQDTLQQIKQLNIGIHAMNDFYVIVNGNEHNEKNYYVIYKPKSEELIEKNRAILAKELYSLPVSEFVDYIEKLRQFFIDNEVSIRNAVLSLKMSWFLPILATIPYLLDSKGVIKAIEQELSGKEGAGVAYLDKWCTVDTTPYYGWQSDIRDSWGYNATKTTPQIRAFPTRQLHITAGNSPHLPILSLVRALSSKGAAVIKTPSEVIILATLLSVAMHSIAPNHAITRHTSFVYWQGGDNSVENALFEPYAFDRIVVWGSPSTVQSVKSRALYTKVICLNPRYGMSFIDLTKQDNESLEHIAHLACTDSIISNQKACTASLIHYVKGTEEQILQYCKELQQALLKWDQKLSIPLPPSTIGQIRLLQRKEFIQGTWFFNGSSRCPSSCVVYLPHSVDLTLHPQSRFIIVQRVSNESELLEHLNESVSTIGIYPESVRMDLRDSIAAYGVSNILPLGQCERVYTGMPHDGMRILSELCNWENS